MPLSTQHLCKAETLQSRPRREEKKKQKKVKIKIKISTCFWFLVPELMVLEAFYWEG
jgi:hypothetical protein